MFVPGTPGGFLLAPAIRRFLLTDKLTLFLAGAAHRVTDVGTLARM
jgi:hypothetical protein